MARILRGEVYWADLNPVRGREQAGLRPVLILSHDLFNRKSETVIAMAITSQAQKAGFPLTMALPAELTAAASGASPLPGPETVTGLPQVPVPVALTAAWICGVAPPVTQTASAGPL